MQNLFVEERSAQKEGAEESAPISPWAGSGPILLLLAFAIFLFKTAPSYWPLTLTAFLGFSLIRLLGKRGLLLSLVALCAVTPLRVWLCFGPSFERFDRPLLGTYLSRRSRCASLAL